MISTQIKFPMWKYSKISHYKRIISKLSYVNTKKYDLKLPNNTTSNKKPYFSLDEKLKVIQLSDSGAESTIDKFILPLSSDTGATKMQQTTNSPKLRNLLAAFSVDEDESLPLVKPTDLKETPFEYHSKYNSDSSYVNIPRLSVTKLLTSQWCELRDYYTVFSGSPTKQETKKMKLGTDVHLRLELDTHKYIDVKDMSRLTDVFVEKKITNAKNHITNLTDLHDIQLAKENLVQLIELLHGTLPETLLANDWLDKIISRLFTLINTSEAREVLLHGYLNFETSHFTSTLNDFSSDRLNHILVSGVVDYLKLLNPQDITDYSMFEDIQNQVEFSSVSTKEHQLTDLSQFLEDVKPIINEYGDTYKMRITDVKTRSWNKLPQQESVLDAAKLQSSYYRNMFGVLAGEFDDKEMGYEMLLENAKRRHLDVDKPISLKAALKFLKTHHTFIYRDYVKLANGDALGFEPFDSFVEKKYLNEKSNYDFTKLLENEDTNDFIEQLKATDKNGFNLDGILTPEILKAWKIPLTLRYFAARSAQLFNLFKPFLSDILSIDYLNANTGQCFHTNYYTYNPTEIYNASTNAATFWDGSRPPVPIHDLSKCNYCEFASKCLIPNPHKNVPSSYGSVGSKIKQFIHS